jgi:hypothetical protein
MKRKANNKNWDTFVESSSEFLAENLPKVELFFKINPFIIFYFKILLPIV